ncbi:hypothetical protein N7454_011061 [Penicillium verhagenii]|nr:hypothetical protein N7454_011061 [Penicillium verhagenii]
MLALYFDQHVRRIFRQAAVWELFCHLLCKKLIDIDCLTVPINLFKRSEHTNRVMHFFNCFPYIRQLAVDEVMTNIPCQGGSSLMEIRWLATAISRHGAHLPDLLAGVEASSIFGEIDPGLYNAFKEEDMPNTLDIPRTERDKEALPEHRHPNIFSFWLLHGLSTDRAQRYAEIQAHVQRANNIISCFREMVGSTQNLIRFLILLSDGLRSEDRPSDVDLQHVYISTNAAGLRELDLTSADEYQN